MFLSKVELSNWRRFSKKSDEEPGLTVEFSKGLNVLVGENDSGNGDERAGPAADSQPAGHVCMHGSPVFKDRRKTDPVRPSGKDFRYGPVRYGHADCAP